MALLRQTQFWNNREKIYVIRWELAKRQIGDEEPGSWDSLEEVVRHVSTSMWDIVVHRKRSHKCGLLDFMQVNWKYSMSKKQSPGGFRLHAAVWCCGQVLWPLAMEPSNGRSLQAWIWLSQVYIFHVLLLDHLDLDERALAPAKLPDELANIAEEFLEEICSALAAGVREIYECNSDMLENVKSNTGHCAIGSSPAASTFCDCNDNALFCNMIMIIAENAGSIDPLTPCLRQPFAAAKECLVTFLEGRLANGDLAAGLLDVPEELSNYFLRPSIMPQISPASALVRQAVPEGGRVQHMDHPLVSAILGEGAPLLLGEQACGCAVREESHWHKSWPLGARDQFEAGGSSYHNKQHQLHHRLEH